MNGLRDREGEREEREGAIGVADGQQRRIFCAHEKNQQRTIYVTQAADREQPEMPKHSGLRVCEKCMKIMRPEKRENP